MEGPLQLELQLGAVEVDPGQGHYGAALRQLGVGLGPGAGGQGCCEVDWGADLGQDSCITRMYCWMSHAFSQTGKRMTLGRLSMRDAAESRIKHHSLVWLTLCVCVYMPGALLHHAQCKCADTCMDAYTRMDMHTEPIKTTPNMACKHSYYAASHAQTLTACLLKVVSRKGRGGGGGGGGGGG